MYCQVNIKNHNYKIYYTTSRPRDLPVLVLLHGWGVDSSIFKKVMDQLNYHCVAIDFLGFGQSDVPIMPLSVDDYVEMVWQVVDYLKLKDIIILGHSFGGRVCIKYNLVHPVKEMILVNSAGIKNNSFEVKKQVWKYKIQKRWYKIFNRKKYVELIQNSGSRDYKALNSVMKQTMSKVVNEDLKKYLEQVKIKTSLLWGVNDEETPLNHAYLMHDLLMNSRLFLFYHSGHYTFIDEEKKFVQLINEVK